MISYAFLLNFLFWRLGLYLMILFSLSCERGRTLCVCSSCETGFLLLAVSYLLDRKPSSPGTKPTVSNNNNTQISLLLWNDKLNKRQSSVCLLWLTCCLELQSLCPILFKSNVSCDLATRTEYDTDVHFAKTRSAVRTGELHPGEFSCDHCPENYNLGNHFLNFNNISRFWAMSFFLYLFFFFFPICLVSR